MKIIVGKLCLDFLIFSLIFIPAGCNNHDTGTDKNQHVDIQPQLETGAKPYDTDADQLASRYPGKTAIVLAQLKRCTDFASANGIEKLMDVLKNPDDPRRNSFVSKDFYVWILKTDYKSKAVIEVHPINKAITGRDFLEIKDADGKAFIKDILRIVSYKEKGWVSYKWAHPRLKKAQEKLTYSVRFNDYILSDGFYLKD